MANVGPYNVMFMLPRFLVLTVKMVKIGMHLDLGLPKLSKKIKPGVF